MRYLEARRRAMLEARARKREGAKAATGPAENKALSGPPENKADATPVVTFASERAAELAAELGLDERAFEGLEPSGATGYTVADVRRAAGD